MFSGDWIEHQELNLGDEPVRVIQIWFAADIRYRGLGPHYQQPSRAALPTGRAGDATVTGLIGNGSPMEQHMMGRLTATTVDRRGATTGAGRVTFDERATPLGQYDVLLARRDAPAATLTANPELPPHFLNFYLPRFLP